MPNEFSEPMEIQNPPFQSLETADFGPVTAGQIGDPKNANPIISGEWLTLFDAVTPANTGKLQRAAATDPEPFLYYMDAGSTDSQTTKKGPILLERPKRIKTKLVSGANSLGLGDEVMVGSVTYDSLARAGLLKATSGNFSQGRVLGIGTNTADPDGSYWVIVLHNKPHLMP